MNENATYVFSFMAISFIVGVNSKKKYKMISKSRTLYQLNQALDLKIINY